MSEVKLNCAIYFNDFIDPENVNEIIDAKIFSGGDWVKLHKGT